MASVMAPTEPEPHALLPCKQCRTPIPADAKLCKYCGSYQDWRGHLNVSNTVLALLVALVSVLSVTLPAIISALRPGHSRIVLSSPVIRGEAVYLVASNLGSRPGVIQRGQIQSRYLGMDSELELINPAEAFVGPGAKQIGLIIRLRLGVMDSRMQALGLVSEGLKDPQKQAGTIGVWSQGSSGPATYTTLPVTYEDIMTLLDAHSARCEAATAPPTLENGCSGLRELQQENDRLHEQVQRKLRGAARR